MSRTAAPIILALIASCASRGRSGAAPGSGGDDEGGGGTVFLDGSFDLTDAGAVPVNSLTILPSNLVVDVDVANGAVTNVTVGDSGAGSIAFHAERHGAAVAATWSIDRGELGTMNVSSGTFTPNGNYAGAGTVTAVAAK